jgi:hypothetical protein
MQGEVDDGGNDVNGVTECAGVVKVEREEVMRAG